MRMSTAMLLGTAFSLAVLLTQWNGSSVQRRTVPTARLSQFASTSHLHLGSAVAGRSVASASDTKFSMSDAVKRLHALSECYDSGCGAQRTEGRDTYYEVGQKIRRALIALSKAVRAAHLEDEQVSQLGREFLLNSDGHVKEAALELISTQSTSSENLKAVLDGVILDSDPELIEHGLVEVTRYSNGPDRDRINVAIEDAVLHGSPFVAQKIAQRIDSLLDDTNYAFYSQLASHVDADSDLKNILLSTLSTFKR